MASSFVRGVHREWTRPCDETSFVYCTFGNNKRGWVTKDSLVLARPDLADAVHTSTWQKMRDGGRVKAKPLTSDCVWFHIVHPDEPDQPVHDAVETPDWRARFHECEMRVSKLELDYAKLLTCVYLPQPTSSQLFATPGVGTDMSTFDLDAFVAQHSFSEVAQASGDLTHLGRIDY